jgi:hypothetical protein
LRNEIKQARIHLMTSQFMLHRARITNRPEWLRQSRERRVMAALSWLWDAQERAKPQPVVQEVVFG